ncbi:MAG: RHS repeat-associated core domain-containing protein, partial [Roseburia sp.]
EYNYDPARRWLDTIKTQNKWGQSYQNISYSFDAVGNVLGYENDCLDSVTGNYKTRQTYSYDNLYQLIKVDGETTYNPYLSSVPEFVSNYSQVFSFDTDGLGNMTSKVSTETVTPQKAIGDNLNYKFDYIYDENYAHRLVRAGDRYYKYDENGNIICEQDGSFESNGDNASYHKIIQEAENVYSTDYGWGLFKEDSSSSGIKGSRYRRAYIWNERNQLVSSVDANYNTAYVYGQDGQRSNKYTQSSETLYFNKMWTLHTDSGNNVYGGQSSKNIYLGETRIVTKLNSGENPTYQEEYYKQYFYHSDHLGSASLISDYKGDEYQRIEYTPYGETWVEKTQNTGLEFLPYRFTGKEIDEETGLYYYGARYLDPKYSRWLSTDPALSAYMSGSDVGRGGIYNSINFNLYHYANNTPLKYTDPTGMWVDNEDGTFTAEEGDTLYGLYGEDWQSKSGFTRDPRTLQVGETVGIKNTPCQDKAEPSENKLGKTQNNIPVSINSSYNFSRWSYVPVEGIGVNGGSCFIGSIFLNDKNLSIFASGFFIAQNLVDDYVFFGDVTLFVDGNKIGKSYFQYPDYPFISNGFPYKAIGDANFDFDFTNAQSIEVDLHFRVGIAVDAGINKRFINYSKYRIKLR